MKWNLIGVVIHVPIVFTSQLHAQSNEHDVWVKKLGHSRFAVREAAEAKLRKAGTKSVAALARGMDANDLEVSRRCEQILSSLLNTKTAESVGILRCLASGYQTRASKWAQRALTSEEVEISESEYGDLLVTVNEAPTGSFLLGAGINANAGIVGSIVVEPTEVSLDRSSDSTNLQTFLRNVRAWFGQ